MTEQQDRAQRARDLVRTRRGDYRAPETGRHHHLGTAPVRQPQLEHGGSSYVETAAVQLAERTVGQLQELRTRHLGAMQQAAAALEFELAGRERDAVAAIDAELVRRTVP